MKKIEFTKMVASGNDFVVIGSAFSSQLSVLRSLAKKLCDRKYGIGADGLLVLEKSRIADIKMRIFNADGSEAEMCGNGARCVALYWSSVKRHTSHVKIETRSGVIESQINADNVKIKLTGPKNIKLDIPIKVNKRNLKVNLIDTGVPHAIIFVEGIDEIHVVEIGNKVRNHKEFYPRGTNADFVEAISKDTIAIRTYERGVEDETLACGTGSVAAALIFALKTKQNNIVRVLTKSGEILKVYFDKDNNKFTNVWLEGSAKMVYRGEYYV